MARTVRVTVQVDFEDPAPSLDSATFTSEIALALDTLRDSKYGLGSIDWFTLRVEVADPGDTDDPEWEVVR